MTKKNDLRRIPIKWPAKGTFNYSCAGYDVFYAKEVEVENGYAVTIVVASDQYAAFLNGVSKIVDQLTSCPKLRSCTGKLKTAELGRVMHTIIDPSKNLTQEDLDDMDPQLFKLGEPLLHLGYCNLNEESFQNFAIELLNSLADASSRVKVFLKNGMIYDNLSNFGPFYAFAYACFDSGKNANECYELLEYAGLADRYPKNENFNLDIINFEDIEKLYKVFTVLH